MTTISLVCTHVTNERFHKYWSMQKCQFPDWKDWDLLMPLSLVLWELDGGGRHQLCYGGVSWDSRGVTCFFMGGRHVLGMDLAVLCCCCGTGPLPVMWLILGCCAPLTVWCLCGLWLYSSLSPWGPVPGWQEKGGLLASPVCCGSTSKGLGKSLFGGALWLHQSETCL